MVAVSSLYLSGAIQDATTSNPLYSCNQDCKSIIRWSQFLPDSYRERSKISIATNWISIARLLSGDNYRRCEFDRFRLLPEM
ncbi:MAG: hypothetical protein WAU01_14450 [Saprospiraceae bacterium]